MRFLTSYLFQLFYLLLMSSIGLTYLFHYQLLYHIGWGLSLLIGIVIVINVIFGNYLLKHPNEKIQSIGKFYEKINAYTALFQGIMFLNLCFYALGMVTLKETVQLHWWDWIYGISFSSLIVYGLGCWVFVIYAEKWIHKVSSLFIVLLNLGIGLLFFFYENQLYKLFLKNDLTFLLASFVLQLVSSVVLYQVVLSYGTGLLKKKSTK
jgi:hypothetical protein